MMFHGNILRMIIDVVQRIFMLWLMPPPQKCGILSPYILQSRECAPKSVWGCLLAPPSWIYSIYLPVHSQSTQLPYDWN